MTPRPPAMDPLVEALAAALRAKVRELGRAEAQRASFVFSDAGGPAWQAGAADDVAWAAHLARALHAASDPAALDLLRGLRPGPRTVAELTLTARPGGDRLAASAWIGDLAAAGLVGRDLETDAVALAPLGEAIVALLEAIAAAAADGASATDRPAAAEVPG